MSAVRRAAAVSMALAAFAPSLAAACTCDRGVLPRSFAADRVFLGAPIRIAPQHDRGQRALPAGALSLSSVPREPHEFVFKDSAGEHLAVVTGAGGGDCGTPLEIGTTYLVFGARIDAEHYYVGSCGPAAIPMSAFAIVLGVAGALAAVLGYALVRIVRRLRRAAG